MMAADERDRAETGAREWNDHLGPKGAGVQFMRRLGREQKTCNVLREVKGNCQYGRGISAMWMAMSLAT